MRNLEQAIKSTKKYGGQVEATLSYTISPIHNEAYFVKLAKELEDMQEVRTLFEEHAVHHAVTILTEEHRQALQQIREEMLSTIELNDYRRYQELERKLSVELIRLCENDLIEETYTKAYTMMNNFNDSLIKGAHFSQEGAVTDRVEFIDSLLAGDLDKALELVRGHSERAMEFIRHYVTR